MPHVARRGGGVALLAAALWASLAATGKGESLGAAARPAQRNATAGLSAAAAAAASRVSERTSGAQWTDEIGGAFISSHGSRVDTPGSEALVSVPCSPGEEGPSARFVFPYNGQRLDALVDLSLGRTLLVRLRVSRFRLDVDGRVALIVEGYRMADVRGLRDSGAGKADGGGGGHSFRTIMPVGEQNVEIFGLTPGEYRLQAVILDPNNVGRDCWKGDAVNFTIESDVSRNRSATLLKGIRSYRRNGGRGLSSKTRPYFLQPVKHSDFAYVTVFWGDKYLDNVIAWSAGLRAVGSSFRVICMVIPEMLWEGYARILERCCCEVVGVEPIKWEASSGQTSRYELVLTKLRVYQLARRGVKKVVLMDADMLVLQNIDELFWLPAPSATALIGTFLGDTVEPKMSAGVVVIEPNEAEFQSIMQTLDEYMREPVKDRSSVFFEQDILDIHWSKARPQAPYNMLPFIYNMDPRMLDLMPFLSPREAGEELSASFPLDHGVKAVHLWNWYNPVIATTGSARQSLQLNARLKHKVLWHWYDLWWSLHQEGLARGIPDEFAYWVQHCRDQNVARYGPEHGSRFVPVLMGGGGCLHSRGGLAW